MRPIPDDADLGIISGLGKIEQQEKLFHRPRFFSRLVCIFYNFPTYRLPNRLATVAPRARGIAWAPRVTTSCPALTAVRF